MIKYILKQDLSDLTGCVIDESFNFGKHKVVISDDLNCYTLDRYVFMRIVYCEFDENVINYYDNVILTSCSSPEFIASDNCNRSILYVWGDYKKWNNAIVPIPIKNICEVVSTIDEYNKSESDGEHD